MSRFASLLLLVLMLSLGLGACASKPQGTSSAPSTDPAAHQEADLPATAEPTTTRAASDLLRVGLLVGAQRVRLESLADWEIYELDGRRVDRREGPEQVVAEPSAAGIRLRLGDDEFLDLPTRSLRLSSKGDGPHFNAKGQPYGGDLLLLREPLESGSRSLTLVNLIDIEIYLRGVVPWEIGRPGEEALEAAKAQAIAARTYTLAHLGRRETLGFDLWDSVEDQVYRGFHGIAQVTDRAVRDTAHRVLMYDDDLVQGYYSSTCGGHTSAIEDVWPRSPIPYLEGIRDAPRGESAWCRGSPHFRWSVSWSARELGEIVRARLPAEIGPGVDPRDLGVLTGLSVLERDRSGRVQRLLIVTDRGEWEIWGDRIRWVLRPARGRFGILRSTLFELEEVRDEGILIGVRVKGGGFGHGVGMCQTGALARARAGQDAQEILRAYYPDSRIEGWARLARP